MIAREIISYSIGTAITTPKVVGFLIIPVKKPTRLPELVSLATIPVA